MKKIIITISLLILAIVVIAEAVFWLIPTESLMFDSRMNFLVANESNEDAVIEIYINDINMASQELGGIKNGYFGQEFEYFDLNTPSETFTLKVIEKNGGTEQTMEIDPANGNYISATFWNDEIIIEQTQDQQVRID